MPPSVAAATAAERSAHPKKRVFGGDADR